MEMFLRTSLRTRMNLPWVSPGASEGKLFNLLSRACPPDSSRGDSKEKANRGLMQPYAGLAGPFPLAASSGILWLFPWNHVRLNQNPEEFLWVLVIRRRERCFYVYSFDVLQIHFLTTISISPSSFSMSFPATTTDLMLPDRNGLTSSPASSAC